MAKSRPAHFWSDEETELMLCRLKELNILKYMDGRKTRNGNLFKKVAEQLEDAGFKRTPEQIRVRWKHLKQGYYNARKNNQISGHNAVFCPYSDILEELLGRRPLSQELEYVVGFGFSPLSDSVLGAESLEETAEAESPETAQEPDEEDSESSEETPTPQIQRSNTPPLQRATGTPTSDLPGRKMTPSGMRGRHSSDVELLFQKMQQVLHTWMEQSQKREERLVNSILQSNASLASALTEGIRSSGLQPSMPPNPSRVPHLGTYTGHEYPAGNMVDVCAGKNSCTFKVLGALVQNRHICVCRNVLPLLNPGCTSVQCSACKDRVSARAVTYVTEGRITLQTASGPMWFYIPRSCIKSLLGLEREGFCNIEEAENKLLQMEMVEVVFQNNIVVEIKEATKDGCTD